MNLTLMIQQGSEAKTDLVSPCFTCLERSKSEPIRKGKEPIIIDDANPSDDENSAITKELLRLKDFFETGMFKSI